MQQMVSLLQILLLAQHVSGSILQTGHSTHSSTTDRQLENQSTKHHRQQPPV